MNNLREIPIEARPSGNAPFVSNEILSLSLKSIFKSSKENAPLIELLAKNLAYIPLAYGW